MLKIIVGVGILLAGLMCIGGALFMNLRSGGRSVDTPGIYFVGCLCLLGSALLATL